MKKTISILLICAVLLSVTACANTRRFDSENALMEHLDGMWVVDDTRDDKTYYIFRDGKIYCFNDVQFSYSIEHFFDSFISDGNLAALNKLDYNATISGMGIEEILGNAEENVVIQPSKGKIIIDEGKTYEKHIIITKNAVAVKEADEKASNALNRLSDEADFNGEHFEAIFEETRDNFTIPAAKIVTSENYLSFAKEVFADTNNWILVSQSEQSALYTSDGNITGSFGSYIISDNGLDYFRGRAADGAAAFTIMYDLVGTSNWNLFIYDRTGISLNQLLDYAAPVLSVFPGALSAEQIISLFNQDRKVYSGEYQYKTTENGITYTIKQATNGSRTSLYVNLPEKVGLKKFANHAQTAPEESQVPTTEPPVTEFPSNPGNSGGNTSQQPVSCSHNYASATCTKPKTCTKCGATTGNTTEHTWKNTSCTTPKACSVCGQELVGSVPGHQWKNATCTQPETCAVCKATQGNALGHDVQLTKCSSCDYTDYSAIAKTYPNITAYDGRSGEDLEVTSVSVNNSGVLSFTFNGKSYSITIKQKAYDSMTYFDCYLDGKLLKNATCRVGDASYYNMLHFEWDGVDGHNLYFNTGR